jgi:hypothetical protein
MCHIVIGSLKIRGPVLVEDADALGIENPEAFDFKKIFNW